MQAGGVPMDDGAGGIYTTPVCPDLVCSAASSIKRASLAMAMAAGVAGAAALVF